MNTSPRSHTIKPDEIAALLLGVITLIGCGLAAVLTPPATSAVAYIIWIMLLAAAINLGITLEAGDANFASVIIAATFLSLGLGPAALVTAGGVLLGEVVRNVAPNFFDYTRRGWRRGFVLAGANLSIHGLSILVGGGLYWVLGGPLPIVKSQTGQWVLVNFGAVLLPLLGLFAGYLLTNYAVFGLYHRLEGRSVRAYLRRYGRDIAVLEVVPIVFSILIASSYLNMPTLIFFSFGVFLIVVMTLTHRLSRARTRMQRRVAELDSLSLIGEAVANSLELPEVLEAIWRQTRKLMDARYFFIALYNAQDKQLVFPLAYENDVRVRYESRPYGPGLTEHVIALQKPVLIRHNVRAYVEQMGITPAGPMAQSWLGVPIVFGEQTLGVIAVQNLEQPDSYDEANRDILAAIAAQAATAIHNARMYLTTRHHTTNLAILNSVSMAINSTLDLKRVLDIIVTSVGRVMGNQKAAIFLVDEPHQRVLLAASHGLSPHYITQSREMPIGLDERAVVVSTRQPLIVDDILTDDRMLAFRAVARTEGFRAFADVPLQTHARAIGALTVYYADPHHFTLAEIDLLNTFANQAAIAVDNAKLYARTDEALARRIDQLAALAEIGRELTSSLDVDHVIQHVLDRAMTSTRAACGSIGLWQPDRQAIRVMGARGYPSGQESHQREIEWPLTRGLVGRALRTGEVVCVGNVRAEPDYASVLTDVQSELVVPIKTGEHILGVINLASTLKDHFDQQAVDFVSQLATQAAIALKNAQLYAATVEARDQLQATLDSAHDGILIFDTAGRVVMVNPQLERLWQQPRARLQARSLLDLSAEADIDLARKLGLSPAGLWTQVQQLQAGTASGWPKDVFALPDGDHASAKRYVERTCTPVRDANAHAVGWLLTLRDVTEERELQDLRTDLINTIVHDLRSPLSSMLGSLYLLKDMLPPGPPDAEEQQTVDISLRSTRKMLDLVNSLLDISKLESGQAIVNLRPAPLSTVIEAALERLSPLAAEAGITLDKSVPAHLPLVHIDDEMIGRVIINLLDNALKFTPQGGRVTVLAQLVDAEWVRCAVRDTGPGIPPEARGRIFERFAQLGDQPGRRRGSGLGLSFCQLAVGAHGGTIGVGDAPGGGSEFAFTVKIAAPATRSRPAPA